MNNLQIPTHELVTTWKDFRAQGKHPAGNLSWLTKYSLVVASGTRLADLAKALPTQGSWTPSPERQQGVLARDSVLFAGMLSTWKVLRLIQTFCGTWQQGAHGFDGVTAAVTLRTAMEESARLVLSSHAVFSLLESHTEEREQQEEVLALAERLLDSGEHSGLEESPQHRWKALARIKEATPTGPLFRGGAEASEDIYGHLSTFVHPKGVSRKLFRKGGFSGGAEHVSIRPTKSQSIELIGVCLAAYIYVAEATVIGFERLHSCAQMLDERSKDQVGCALLCFADDFYDRLLKVEGSHRDATSIVRRGVWHEAVIRDEAVRTAR